MLTIDVPMRLLINSCCLSCRWFLCLSRRLSHQRRLIDLKRTRSIRCPSTSTSFLILTIVVNGLDGIFASIFSCPSLVTALISYIRLVCTFVYLRWLDLLMIDAMANWSSANDDDDDDEDDDDADVAPLFICAGWICWWSTRWQIDPLRMSAWSVIDRRLIREQSFNVNSTPSHLQHCPGKPSNSNRKTNKTLECILVFVSYSSYQNVWTKTLPKA